MTLHNTWGVKWLETGTLYASTTTLPELVLQPGHGHRLQTMINNQEVVDKQHAFTIFMVDDDPDVRRAMKRLLKTAKFKVEAFATA